MVLLLAGCSKPDKDVPVVGFLDAFEDNTISQAKHGFFDALKKNGYSEDQKTLSVIYRNAQGDDTKLILSVQYFIAQNVTLMATNPSSSTIIAIQNTKDVPVFMMVAPTPELMKVVAADGKEPANLFGVGESLEYIDTSFSLIPKLVKPKEGKLRVGMLYNQSEPQSEQALNRIKQLADQMNIELVGQAVSNTADVQLATQSLLTKNINAFFANPDNTIFGSFETIIKACNAANVPVFTSEEGLVSRGAVAAYGADIYQWGYQAGEQAAVFLKNKSTHGLKWEMVKLRKRVYNPAAAKRFNIEMPAGFDAVETLMHGESNSPTTVVKTKNAHIQFYLTAIILGLCLSAMALGIFITMKIFGIPDITTDGSYTLGAVVTAILLMAHWHAWAIIPVVMLVGALAGSLTGIIHTKLKIDALLAGILVMTGLYSVNLTILGRSNVPLRDVHTAFSAFHPFSNAIYNEAAIGLGFVIVLTAILSYLLKTDFGIAMRATGNSPSMTSALGINNNAMKITGLAMANGLTALSGYLVAQYQNDTDINMGIGIVITGLGSVLIGDALIKWWKLRSVVAQLVVVLLGSLTFQLVLAFTLSIGVNPNLLKLVTSVMVLLIVSIPRLRRGKT
jgi:putative ABC transport system substrate-binding protein